MKRIKEANEGIGIYDVYYYSLLSAVYTMLEEESEDKFVRSAIKPIEKILLAIERHFDSKHPNWDEVYEDILLDADDAMDKIQL